MYLGLFVLLLFVPGFLAQARKPEEFCNNNKPAVYRDKFYAVTVNQTFYQYGRGLEVTVTPKANSTFRVISDMFLYVEAPRSHPGHNNTKFLGKWYAQRPLTALYCDQYLNYNYNQQYGRYNNGRWGNTQRQKRRYTTSGMKMSAPSYPERSATATWIAPMPEYTYYYGRYYSNPRDRERTRPHIYFSVYVTPDPPSNHWAPGSWNRRKWFFAHSGKIENNEIRMINEKKKEKKRQERMMLDLIESMN